MVGWVAALGVALGLWSAYLAGYDRGNEEALDWDFSAVTDGKVVRLGPGHALLRSRVQYTPVWNVNIVTAPLKFPAAAGSGNLGKV